VKAKTLTGKTEACASLTLPHRHEKPPLRGGSEAAAVLHQFHDVRVRR
jgi:hypothetical protein